MNNIIFRLFGKVFCFSEWCTVNLPEDIRHYPVSCIWEHKYQSQMAQRLSRLYPTNPQYEVQVKWECDLCGFMSCLSLHRHPRPFLSMWERIHLWQSLVVSYMCESRTTQHVLIWYSPELWKQLVSKCCQNNKNYIFFCTAHIHEDLAWQNKMYSYSYSYSSCER